MRTTLLIALATILTACPQEYPRSDAGDIPPWADGGGRDGTVPFDAGTPTDAGPRRDGGSLPTMSVPTAPAEIVSTGSGGFLLRGTVLAPTSVISPGEVLIVGNTITCVAADCSGEPMAGSVTVINTNGIISPGLIDAHNHITYNFIGEWDDWEGGELWDNRDQWRGNAEYSLHVAPRQDDPPSAGDTGYGQTETERMCAGAVWGELRSIIHGTTTVQGQTVARSCFNRLARNAENYHGLELAYGNLRTSIASVDQLTKADAKAHAAALTGDAQRLAVHMQEGVSGQDNEFDEFAGRPPSAHLGLSLLEFDGTYESETYSYSGTAVLIHSISLTDEELVEVAATHSHIVWSPSSNMVLYGATADIGRILELGITVGMGPDWTPSGTDDLLSEMRFGEAYAQSNGIAAVTPEQLWRMVTVDGASVVGMDSGVGALVPGLRADIAVFGREGADPHRALLDSRAQDVRLVMIDGAAYYGDAALEAATAINGDCDPIDACGTAKFLCLANTPEADGDPSGETDHVPQLRANVTTMIDRFASVGGGEFADLIVCE